MVVARFKTVHEKLSLTYQEKNVLPDQIGNRYFSGCPPRVWSHLYVAQFELVHLCST